MKIAVGWKAETQWGVRTRKELVKAAKQLEVGRATLYRFIRDYPEAVPENE